MQVQDIVKASMRKLSLYASGETPSVNELNDGLSALQSMLRAWESRRLLVFASTKENVTLVPGQYLYAWGTDGDINTTRPSQLLGCYITDSEGVTHTIDIISEDKYRSISVKGTVSRPYALYFQPTYPLANVYLYPVPSDVETMVIDSLKPFTETSSFSGLTDTLAFPPNYEEAITYNLAVRLADEYGKAVTASIAAIATATLDSIIAVNSSNQVTEAMIITPASSPQGTRYSINSDTYH
jgi:hypothetical protein